MADFARHGGKRYTMRGPWNETSCEYYEEIQELACLTATREVSWGIAAAAHARFHYKLMSCAGTLATASRRVQAINFAAHSREEARTYRRGKENEQRLLFLPQPNPEWSGCEGGRRKKGSRGRLKPVSPSHRNQRKLACSKL